MTTCSSSSDDPDLTSTSDVDEDIDDHELSLGHIRENDGVENRSSSDLKTGSSRCGDDVTSSYTCSPLTYSTDSKQIMEAEAGYNGIDVESEVTCGTLCSHPKITSSNKVDDSAVVCLANGLVSDIPSSSTLTCVTSSHIQLSSLVPGSDASKDSVTADTAVSQRASSADCTNCTVNSKPKPSLTNSIPILSIPRTDHSCIDDNNPSIFVSPFRAEDSTVPVMPPSVFSVPCVGNEVDGFTEVNLDDDTELPRGTNSLSVQAAVSAESSRDSSPSRLRLATSSSSIHLDDAIVQSVLCDDDDDDDASHTVSSTRHSASIAFTTNTDSAAFRTPVCAAATDVPLKDDGLHVVEPDTASFEEISLQSTSSNALESRNVVPEQTVTSVSKRSGLANFFAR